ncbi:protein of unknown function [Mesotoga infera]|uniref:Uncharacterized protein n=1 Tax=Mesotoga infera TaxID=1236046 RepID=A0A7Z7LEM1_9BACT|nr:protein of unknown function [Mesotoga infera]
MAVVSPAPTEASVIATSGAFIITIMTHIMHSFAYVWHLKPLTESIKLLHILCSFSLC